MKIDPVRQAWLDRKHAFEVQLLKEARNKQDIIKHAAKKQLEVELYEKRANILYLIKHTRLGKHLDTKA